MKTFLNLILDLLMELRTMENLLLTCLVRKINRYYDIFSTSEIWIFYTVMCQVHIFVGIV